MKYANPIVAATFLKRPNRFVAHVELEGREEMVHVKNTGRMKELMVPGTRVYLEDCRPHPHRKTLYSLIAAEKGKMLVNTDSQAPNAVVAEALALGQLPPFPIPEKLRREVTYGQSRFDMSAEWESGKGLLEVKGVTLEHRGISAFPDAPTTRGAKHVLELAKAAQKGYQAAVVFLLQMKGPELFVPHWNRDPVFGKALITAREAGVQILAYDAHVTPGEMIIGDPVFVRLEPLTDGRQPD